MSESPLHPGEIAAALQADGIASQIVVAASTNSTNDDARRMGLEGAAHGLAVFAEEQLAGRGRRGSQWISPPGKNLLCSVLVRPNFPMEHWPRLTHAAALAITLALESIGLEPRIKWPNDVWVRDRKIAGILLEVSSAGETPFAIIGFGLNVNLRVADFPENLRPIATSAQIEAGHSVSRLDLAIAILRNLNDLVSRTGEDFAAVLDEVRLRSLLLGKRIALTREGLSEIGTAAGLAENGALLFTRADGATEAILSADNVREVR